MISKSNFLAEGFFSVTAAITTLQPFNVHLAVDDVINFRIVDRLDGSSARGDYAGSLPGVVRPILNWDTEFKAN